MPSKKIKLSPYFTTPDGKPLPGGIAAAVKRKAQPADFYFSGFRNQRLSAKIDEHTRFRMASVSKQYTAAAILCCERQNKLSLSDRIGSYLPDLAPPLQEISIQQLLNHSSGIIDYEQLIPKDQSLQLKDKDVVALIRENGNLYFLPGSQFRYSNTGYCLLTPIIEKATGLTYPQFLRQTIFDPYQLNETIVYDVAKNIANRAYGFRYSKTESYEADQNIMSATQGDGGIYTSINDYMRWMDLLFSERFLPEYINQLLHSEIIEVKDGVFYNRGWFISQEQDGTSCVYHSGESTGFRNLVYYNLDKKLMILLFSNIEGKEKKLSKLFESFCSTYQLEYRLQEPLMTWLSRIYSP